jgi:hypothetical protein
MRFGFVGLALWGFGLALSACTTIDNDLSTGLAPVYRTRVDFDPPSREERIRQVQFEKKVLARKEAELEPRIESLRAEREELYASLAARFPECRSQRHCLSRSLTQGSIAKFEEFRGARKKLGELDAALATAEDELALWRRREGLRERAIYNRYLVREFLAVPKADPRILKVMVHSLEAFRDRRSLSLRLIELADPTLVPALVGELDFSLLGKPVDEAAVIATLQVAVAAGNEVENYLLTLLVNTHQTDPQAYEEAFLRAWASYLGEPNQVALRELTFCGIPSIASPLLLGRLNLAKTKNCGPKRDRRQLKSGVPSVEVNSPTNWLIPVSYSRL